MNPAKTPVSTLQPQGAPPFGPLAISGGAPVIAAGPPAWPVETPEVLAALQQLWQSGNWGRYHGIAVDQLQTQLSEWWHVPWVMACCSGTLAVELALRGLGVGPGDEVLLAAYDFGGNFHAVQAVGAKPVLVDIEPATGQISTDAVALGITGSTKAVVASHLHGGAIPVATLLPLLRAHGIPLVEDACQCPGAVLHGKVAGTHGQVGVVSFGGSKLLTAGRGGAILTPDEAVIQRIRRYTERGNQTFPLSELQAAVLLPQLKTLAAQHQLRAVNVACLLTLLEPCQALIPLAFPAPPELPGFYKVGFWYRPLSAGGQSRELFCQAVRAEGVALDPGFRHLADKSNARCRKSGELTHSRAAGEQLVVLHHPVLLEPEPHVQAVAQAILKVEHAFRNGWTA